VIPSGRKAPHDARPARHPIQVAARRAGLTPDALRAWERRYGTITPARERGRRFYSDEDIERLTLLKRATDGGRRIGDVAALSTDELRALVAEDATRAAGEAREDPRARQPNVRSDAQRLERSLDAIRQLDAARLEDELHEAGRNLSTPRFLERVVVPLLEEVGSLWAHGELSIASEHLATAAVRSLVSGVARSRDVPVNSPVAVFTTPAEQKHELGALMASVTAASVGWRTIYLGPSLPAADIARAARANDAQLVGLSIIFPDDDPCLPGELRRVREHLDDDVALLVGGRAARAYEPALSDIGARHVADYPELVEELARMHTPRST
jgi:DNA-binding transcriptional MerR regulator/methylmalonyl-CoA mutase cobalamin-binding subunit